MKNSSIIWLGLGFAGLYLLRKKRTQKQPTDPGVRNLANKESLLSIKDFCATPELHLLLEEQKKELAEAYKQQNTSGVHGIGGGNITETQLTRKISKFIQEVGLRELTTEQEQIYNVFAGERNIAEIQISDMLGLFHLFKIYGDNPNKGAAHILIKHYNEPEDNVTTDEILNMCEIIKNTEPYEEDGKRVYETVKDGIRYRVVIALKNDTGVLVTFYTNRK